MTKKVLSFDELEKEYGKCMRMMAKAYFRLWKLKNGNKKVDQKKMREDFTKMFLSMIESLS